MLLIDSMGIFTANTWDEGERQIVWFVFENGITSFFIECGFFLIGV
ncbi:hypothetical protein BTHERMOSOX_1725 [Bathymodiolus thermophilus thioautotrophic gill symbiont]|nr:hypothetical protein BTHERMOSOX_1725 [Bathymodiolus thermophilus thioautotrophic gill symbiont]